VALDPGHGGSETGAISPRIVLEKKVTLDIAKRVRKHLQDTGATVRLTRDRDRNLGLRARTAMAAQWNADLFVSIHLNSASNPQAEGIET
jgi:N-acetylmuramoyl-L-alanine amidase